MIANLLYKIKCAIKKPFKVGIIAYYYPHEKNINNGVAMHTYYLSRELAALGCDVHVFTNGTKDKIKTEYLGEGRVVVHSINTSVQNQVYEPTAKKKIGYLIFEHKIIHEFTEAQIGNEFDVIHTHGWLTSGAFISKLLHNIKWVHTFHALEKDRIKFMTKEERRYKDISNWIESTIKHADAMIAVSEALKKEIIAKYRIKKEKIQYIPNGIDLDIFYPSQKKEKTITYVGRFSKEKGITILPEIMEKVLSKDKKAKFIVIAPRKNLPESLKKTSQEFDSLLEKYPERIKMPPQPLSNKELSEIYRQSQIYIQPSEYESFGMCVLEAMACGNAIICSDKGGMPALVKNAGITTKLNTNTFADNILKLLQNQTLRKQYSLNAIARAKNYEWKKIAKETLELYKNV